VENFSKLKRKMEKMTIGERRCRRFTETFKQEQVSLIERGKITQAQVSRKYDVRVNCVRAWVDKYGKNRKKGLILMGSSKDYDKLAELEKENKRLKEFIGEQHIELVYLKKLADLAKGKLGDDLEKK
jgi:transposase-like protein